MHFLYLVVTVPLEYFDPMNYTRYYNLMAALPLAFNLPKGTAMMIRHLHTKFQAISISGLPYRHDKTFNFSQIIFNNISYIHQIHTKSGMEIFLYILLICTKFQV